MAFLQDPTIKGFDIQIKETMAKGKEGEAPGTEGCESGLREFEGVCIKPKRVGQESTSKSSNLPIILGVGIIIVGGYFLMKKK